MNRRKQARPYAYLALPHSHPDKSVRDERAAVADMMLARLATLGLHCFSPISHTHRASELMPEDTKSWDFWESFDLPFIEGASMLLVVTMPGWQESKGIRAEIDLFNKAGKPVHFLSPPSEYMKEPDYD